MDAEFKRMVNTKNCRKYRSTPKGKEAAMRAENKRREKNKLAKQLKPAIS